MSKCILVTGLGHAGTRLVNRMLAKHPSVSVPLDALNHVSEFPALHRIFIESMDATPLYSDSYAIDEQELRFILDSYQTLLADAPFHTLKMPYYPYNCLDEMRDYYDGHIAFVSVNRPIDKIVRSYQRRGEDRRYFVEDSRELLRQIKKLPVDARQSHLARRDPPAFFRALAEHADSIRDAWSHANPAHAFIEVEIERFATTEAYARSILEQLGISPDPAVEMLEIVEEQRLMEQRSLRGVLRGVRRKAGAKLEAWVPPTVLELLRGND